MSTNRFSNYSEKDLLSIVAGLSDNSIKFTIPELKELQSELINKRIDPQKIGLISNVIMNQMNQSEKSGSDVRERRSRRAETRKMKVVAEEAVSKEPDMPTAEVKNTVASKPKPAEPKAEVLNSSLNDKKQNKKAQAKAEVFEEDEYFDDDEKFPVLNFLVVFYRVIGWLCVLLLVGGYAAVGYLMLKDNMPMLICGGGLALVTAGLLLLFFSAKAESILVKLEIEKHLRKLIK